MLNVSNNKKNIIHSLDKNKIKNENFRSNEINKNSMEISKHVLKKAILNDISSLYAKPNKNINSNKNNLNENKININIFKNDQFKNNDKETKNIKNSSLIPSQENLNSDKNSDEKFEFQSKKFNNTIIKEETKFYENMKKLTGTFKDVFYNKNIKSLNDLRLMPRLSKNNFY